MTPQELAALKKLNDQMKGLVGAVKELTKVLDRVHDNIVTSFRTFHEKPLPPLTVEGNNQEDN